jgi:deoxycytidine triphosphate deaminase
VLPHQDILGLCRAGVIQNFEEKQVKTASYDMRVGLDYHLKAKSREKFLIQTLDKENAGIVVNPNAVVIVSLHEHLQLPHDMVGHLSLKVELLLQGLIMANQSQIDAGYSGQIFALLYNLSDQPVVLKHLDEIVRLELHRMEVATEQRYEGSFTDKGLSEVLRQPVGSSLQNLDLQFVEMKSNVDRKIAQLQIAGVVALGATIGATVYFGFFGPWSGVVHDVGELQGQQTQIHQIHNLERQVEIERRRLATLIARVEHLRQPHARSAGGGK